MRMIRSSHDVLQININIVMQHRACEPQTLCIEIGMSRCRHAAVLTSEPMEDVCVRRAERYIPGTLICAQRMKGRQR
jgi:hypothetical protein